MELLKQPLGKPLSLADMVITLVAAVNKKFVSVPVDKMKAYQADMLEYIHSVYPQLSSFIETEKTLDDSVKEQILNAADEFKKVNNG